MKKLLALVLALVMTLGLATVSTNAAFTDDEKIDHQEAVEVMNSLNIINGMGDGSFQPDGNVTRAQMAKMVSIAMLGEIDPAAFADAKSDLTDIKGHWAEGYIKFCVSQGIVAGRGNGKFDPEDNVTTAEAAKMLLVALGYNAEVQKYTGNQWTLNVMRDAQQRGLLDELTKTATNNAMDRDDAAQMIYNTLTTERIIPVPTYNSDGTTATQYQIAKSGVGGNVANAKDETLLGASFNGLRRYGYITGITYDANKKLYSYNFASTTQFNSPVIGTNDDGIGATNATTGGTVNNLKSSVDYSDLWGQRVAIVYDLDTSKTERVYGVYSDADVLATAPLGKINKGSTGDWIGGTAAATGLTAETKVDMNGTTVTLDTGDNTNATNNVFTFVGTAGGETAGLLNAGNVTNGTLNAMANYAGFTAANKTGYTVVTAVDNDDDGSADAFIIYPEAWGKVSYASSSTITASNVAYTYNTTKNNWSTTADTAPFYTMPSGVAKGDYIRIPMYGVPNADRTVTKIEAIQGKVTGEKTAQAQINGNWYGKNGVTLTLNNTYDVWMINNFAIDADVVSADANDLALLIASTAADTLSNAKAKLLFPDGKTEIVEVKKVDDTSTAAGTTGNPTAVVTADKLVTYSKDSDGVYTLKGLSTANLAGASSFVAAYDNDYTAKTSTAAAKIGAANYLIADDAQVYVKYNTGGTAKYSAVTGTTLKTYTDIANGTNGNLLLKNVNGVNYVYAVVIQTAATTFGTDSLYGYITSDPYTAKNGSDTVYVYDVWTADGALDAVMDTYTGAAPNKGDVIEFTKNTDGTITRAAAIAGGFADKVAITGSSDTDKTVELRKTDGLLVDTGAESIPVGDKTTVLFINGKDKAGVAGGTIATAQQLTTGGYNANAFAVYDTTADKLLCLVVDTTNKYNDTATACGYTVNMSGTKLTDTGTWNLSVTDVTIGGISFGTTPAGTEKAVYGETVVVTYTQNSTGIATLATTTTLTGTTSGSGFEDAVAAIKTTPTFPAGTGTIAAANNIITVTKGTSTAMNSGVFTMTWRTTGAVASGALAATSANS